MDNTDIENIQHEIVEEQEVKDKKDSGELDTSSSLETMDMGGGTDFASTDISTPPETEFTEPPKEETPR